MKNNLYSCLAMAFIAAGISNWADSSVAQSSGPQLENCAEDTLREIQTQVLEPEYEINFQNDFAAFMAPNRAQNLRFRFHETGFSASLRDQRESAFPWEMTLSLQSFSRLGQPGRQPEISNWIRVASKQHIEAAGPDLAIHYLNDRNGLKQDFTLKQRPPGRALVSLNFQVQREGVLLNVPADSPEVEFLNIVSGERVARYTKLAVFDANQRQLSAQFLACGEDSFAILLDDTDAAYPILVDPTLVADGNITNPQAGSSFGFVVAYMANLSRGNVTGGILVGAPDFDSGGYNDAGKAFYFATAGGSIPSSPTWTYTGTQTYQHVGYSIAGADIGSNTYGFRSIAVGAWGHTGNYAGEGAVFIFYATYTGTLATSPSVTLLGGSAYANMGWSLVNAGDVDGNGYEDLLVGSPSQSSGGYSYNGSVKLYYGTSSGLNTTPWTAYGGISSQTFGKSVAAGDVNGDGYSDLIVGAPGPYWSQAGAVYVFHGSSSGPSWAATKTGGSVGDQFGACVASSVPNEIGNLAPDQNGDDYQDVLVGATHATYNSKTEAGKVYLYRGSSTGLGSPVWTDGGTQDYGYFGTSIALGVLDTDNQADVMIGSPGYDFYPPSVTDDGRVTVYISSQTGNKFPVAQAYNNGLTSGASLGTSVAQGFPLVNGDRNVIAGAPGGGSGFQNVQVWKYSP